MFFLRDSGCIRQNGEGHVRCAVQPLSASCLATAHKKGDAPFQDHTTPSCHPWTVVGWQVPAFRPLRAQYQIPI